MKQNRLKTFLTISSLALFTCLMSASYSENVFSMEEDGASASASRSGFSGVRASTNGSWNDEDAIAEAIRLSMEGMDVGGVNLAAAPAPTRAQDSRSTLSGIRATTNGEYDDDAALEQALLLSDGKVPAPISTLSRLRGLTNGRFNDDDAFAQAFRLSLGEAQAEEGVVPRAQQVPVRRGAAAMAEEESQTSPRVSPPSASKKAPQEEGYQSWQVRRIFSGGTLNIDTLQEEFVRVLTAEIRARYNAEDARRLISARNQDYKTLGRQLEALHADLSLDEIKNFPLAIQQEMQRNHTQLVRDLRVRFSEADRKTFDAEDTQFSTEVAIRIVRGLMAEVKGDGAPEAIVIIMNDFASFEEDVLAELRREAAAFPNSATRKNIQLS